MCEKTKSEKESLEKNEDAEIINDQTERSYYYDDSCGYEIYIEDEQEEN